MGSAELQPQTLAGRDACSRGLAAPPIQHPLPTNLQRGHLGRKPSRIFSGLTADSMSNMLFRNNEAGHQPFHLTHFQVARAGWFLTLTWFT